MTTRPGVPAILPERYRRRVGRVDMPQEAFLAVLKVAAGSDSED